MSLQRADTVIYTARRVCADTCEYFVGRAVVAKCVVPTQDGNIITSSGVSAGMDMVMFFIDKIAGPDVANQVAAFTEYDGQWTNPGADKWA